MDYRVISYFIFLLLNLKLLYTNKAGHKVKEINIQEIEKLEVTPGKSLITSSKISIAQLKEIFK